jgi:hypothetical protein
MGCFASKEEKISKSKAKKDTGFKRPQWRADGQWDEKELKVCPRKLLYNLVAAVITGEPSQGRIALSMAPRRALVSL